MLYIYSVKNDQKDEGTQYQESKSLLLYIVFHIAFQIH